MLTVWKYPINPSDEAIELKIPGGRPILSAALDPSGQPCVWAMVNEGEKEESVFIYCIGTGWPLDRIVRDEAEGVNFIGTVKDGIYIWHIFTEGVVA